MPLDAERVQTVVLADGSQYDLYLPTSCHSGGEHRLLVSAQPYLEDRTPPHLAVELCVDLAEARCDAVLAPRFDFYGGFQWLGLWDPRERQPIPSPKVRFDLQLLTMVEDAVQRFGLPPPPFDLFGYSAGGQFSHRFLYVHPECLNAVAIGAPGSVTVPSMEYAWPQGLAGLKALAGIEVDLASVRQSRILLFVGDQDVTSEFLELNDAANQFGLTRMERARTLHERWQDAGIVSTLTVIPGMDHGGFRDAMGVVSEFFLGC